MKRLQDILSNDDKAKVARWADERRNPKYDTEIPPEFYVAGQLGYYYGWQAVESFMRGYYFGVDDAGNTIQLEFSFETAVALIKAAEKVKYRQIVDEGRIHARENRLNFSSNDYVKLTNSSTETLIRQKTE